MAGDWGQGWIGRNGTILYVKSSHTHKHTAHAQAHRTRTPIYSEVESREWREIEERKWRIHSSCNTWCVAVYGSVLQGCCSVWQFIAPAIHGVLQCIAVCCKGVAVFGSSQLLQYMMDWVIHTSMITSYPYTYAFWEGKANLCGPHFSVQLPVLAALLIRRASVGSRFFNQHLHLPLFYLHIFECDGPC